MLKGTRSNDKASIAKGDDAAHLADLLGNLSTVSLGWYTPGEMEALESLYDVDFEPYLGPYSKLKLRINCPQELELYN